MRRGGISLLILLLAACGGSETAPPCGDACTADARIDGPPEPDAGLDMVQPDLSPPKLQNGEACQAAGQCKSGHCVDDVCCDGACGGTCEACNLTGSEGTCTPIPPDAGPRMECAGDPTCGNGVCDGSGACSYPNAGQTCGSICISDNLVVSTCDDKYKCVAQAPKSCSPYACNVAAGACLTDCLEHGHCNPASACDRTEAHLTGMGTCVDPAQAVKVAAGQEIATVVASTTKPVVLVPAGFYIQPLVVNKTVKIIGLGLPSNPSKIDPAGDGPVIFIKDGVSLTLQGLTLQGATDPYGSGIRCFGFATPAALTVVESVITGHTGYGIEATYCDVTLRRNVIQGNQAGGAKLSDGTFVVVNNVIVNNGSLSSSSVGGLLLSPSTATSQFHNNTIAYNVASSTKAAGIICSGGETFINSIVYGNLGSGQHSGCTFTYSDVEGGAAGTGNIDINPSFTATHVPQASACFDSGTATTSITAIDITGGPRLKGSAVDMGAYEVQ